MKYFNNVRTLDELRKIFKGLLILNHPDNGGNEDIMKAINAEYDEVFKALKAGVVFTDDMTKAAKMAWDETQDELIRQALSKIVFFPDINIEIVGSWVWVDGLTMPIKEQLKEYGFTWSKARKKWHYCPYETNSFYKGKRKSFDSIRAMYGSTVIDNERKAAITA